MTSSFPTTTAPVACHTCAGPTIGWGKDGHGNPRRFCKACKKSFGIIPPRPLGKMRISMEQAVLVISLLSEGSSIRSAERVTGVHRDTIGSLLLAVGDKCGALLGRMVHGVAVKDVQADELWCYVAMKEKTKVKKEIVDPEIGDAYTFLAIERTSKLILAHHVGRRTSDDAYTFAAKLSTAVDGGRFQMSTDGFDGYPAALEAHLGGQIDYAQLIKSYSGEGMDSERRYSPPSIIATEKRVVSGTPEESKICTSHVERLNLHVRMMTRRFTRLTTGFSKKRDNLKAAVALFVASYNFTWCHRTLKGCTPAMAAGICRKPWTMGELLAA